MSSPSLVLPRPGTVKSSDAPRSIKAPSEDAFVKVFGRLLPPASYLQTPKGRVAYYELPASSPAPTDLKNPISRVVFVHGIQTCALGLQPLAAALSSRFPHAHCVLFDHWGHGLTDTPVVPHEPALFHELLETLMAHLGWEDAHFIGYSFGGSTTASFTAARPKRVTSMVLVAPAGLIRAAQFNEVQRSYLKGGEGLEEQAKDFILTWLEGGRLAMPSDWKERIKRGEVVAEAVRDWEMKQHEGHPASVIAIFRDGGCLDEQVAFAEAAKTGVENFCVLGELDGVCTVQDLDDVGFRNVAVVPLAGHGVVRERVPEVAQLIGDYWSKLQ